MVTLLLLIDLSLIIKENQTKMKNLNWKKYFKSFINNLDVLNTNKFLYNFAKKIIYLF